MAKRKLKRISIHALRRTRGGAGTAADCDAMQIPAIPSPEQMRAQNISQHSVWRADVAARNAKAACYDALNKPK